MRATVHRLSRLLALLAAACVIVLMVATTVDVAWRTATGRSIAGTIEASEVLLVVLVFSGLAYAQHTKTHVAVNVLTARLPVRAAGIVRSAGLLVICALLAWMSVVTGLEGWRSMLAGEVRFGIRAVPIWPARVLLPIGVLLLLLEALIDLRDQLAAASGRSEGEPNVHHEPKL